MLRRLIQGQLPFLLHENVPEDADGSIRNFDLEVAAIFGQPSVGDEQHIVTLPAEVERDGFQVAEVAGAAFNMENHAFSARVRSLCSSERH